MSRQESCRSCGSRNLRQFLSLGETPLADALLPPEKLAEPEPAYPLEMAFCPDCTLVQVTENVPPQVLFVDNYLYFSSFSPSVLEHSREHALGLIEKRRLGPGSLVVEVASNDGYLLKNFAERGIPVLGIDPAPDQAAAAEAIGVPTLREFFGIEFAERLRAEGQRADVIIANNVMAHVPDLNGFVAGLRELVADDGVITVENPYVRDLIEHCEFDTVYHEHHCYFSCTAVDRLVRRHGLFLNDVEYFPWLHGGTLRWHIGPNAAQTARAQQYLADEAETGVTQAEYYESFAARVEGIRSELRRFIAELKAKGQRVAAYGAAAKGATLLNYSGLGTESIDFVVDRNPHKHGLLMPGAHIPIRPVEALLDEQPDVVLLLAWNFKDEIVRQQAEYLRRGGKLLLPVPEVSLLTFEQTRELLAAT
ncbi:MAG: class I SAM-dependent methyltransferase [Dehalococcoidia bacterium]|nr:class I SAM-dependent methyltransferase [Dehalococcoidia bacterium]